MSTDTILNQFILNKLTKEQYKNALDDGDINNNELYFLTDSTLPVGADLFDYKFTDHELNNPSWVRADDFRWHYGLDMEGNNTVAYQHLLDDYNNLPKCNVECYAWLELAGNKVLYLPDTPDNNPIVYDENGMVVLQDGEYSYNSTANRLIWNDRGYAPSTALNKTISIIAEAQSNITYYAWTDNNTTVYTISTDSAEVAGTYAYIKVNNFITQQSTSGYLITDITDDTLNINVTGYTRDEDKDEILATAWTDLYNTLNITVYPTNSSAETYDLHYYKVDDGHLLINKLQIDKVEAIYPYVEDPFYVIDLFDSKYKLPVYHHYGPNAHNIGIRGNGKTLGLTNGTNNGGFFFDSGNNGTSRTGLYNVSTGTASSSGSIGTGGIGLTTDATKSGIIGTFNNLHTDKYLYFYIGNYSSSAAEQLVGVLPDELLAKADISLENLDNNGKNIASWSNNITNCVTKIPQDVKLEIGTGTDAGKIIIKKGTKVYIPNGFEADGTTPKFDEYIYQFDKVCIPANSISSFYLFPIPSLATVRNSLKSHTFVSETQPTVTAQYAVWYDITNNIIKFTDNSGSSWYTRQTALPICIERCTEANTTMEIDQVFNGFGYLDKMIFALPGVEYIIPNGRNEDGTLKNIKCSLTNVSTYTDTLNINRDSMRMTLWPSKTINHSSMCVYDSEKNINYNNQTYDQMLCCSAGPMFTRTNGVISNFIQTTTYTLNQKGSDFPSDKYINLTLGATNTEYKAPANGYFVLSKVTTAHQFIALTNTTSHIAVTNISAGTDEGLVTYIPARKNDIVNVAYNAGGTTSYFRFVYAEGEI